MPLLILNGAITATYEESLDIKKSLPQFDTPTRILFIRPDLGYDEVRDEQGYKIRNDQDEVELKAREGVERGLYPMLKKLEKVHLDPISHYTFDGSNTKRTKHDMNIMMGRRALDFMKKYPNDQVVVFSIYLKKERPSRYLKEFADTHRVDTLEYHMYY